MQTTQTSNNALDSFDAVLNPLIALRAHAKYMTVHRIKPLVSTEPDFTPEEIQRALTDAGVYLDKIDPQNQQALDGFARLLELLKGQIRPSHNRHFFSK